MPKDSGLSDMLIVEALSRVEGKIDKLDDRLDDVSVTLTQQHASLEEHMKRSDLLEEKIEIETKKIVDSLPKEVETQIRLQRNKFIISALKVGGVVAGLGGGGLGLKELFSAISKVWGE